MPHCMKERHRQLRRAGGAAAGWRGGGRQRGGDIYDSETGRKAAGLLADDGKPSSTPRDVIQQQLDAAGKNSSAIPPSVRCSPTPGLTRLPPVQDRGHDPRRVTPVPFAQCTRPWTATASTRSRWAIWLPTRTWSALWRPGYGQSHPARRAGGGQRAYRLPRGA